MTSHNSLFNPKKGGVLLGNWVEERSVSYIDSDDPEWLKQGHKCLLSKYPVETNIYTTEIRQKYYQKDDRVKKISCREELTKIAVFDKLTQRNFEQSQSDFESDKIDYQTEMKSSFTGNGFKPSEKLEYLAEDLPKEIPTIWSDTRTNFRRNSHFTKPVGDRLDN